MTASVIEIQNTNALPKTKMRMESAPTVDDARKWSEKIGRVVYWFAKNKSAYAEIGAVDNA